MRERAEEICKGAVKAWWEGEKRRWVGESQHVPSPCVACEVRCSAPHSTHCCATQYEGQPGTCNMCVTVSVCYTGTEAVEQGRALRWNPSALYRSTEVWFRSQAHTRHWGPLDLLQVLRGAGFPFIEPWKDVLTR